jgi:Tfp pilus assembly protein PilX
MSGPATGDRSGFALALVVLLLFAIGVAGATGYQVVTTEFLLAGQNRDSHQALSVAHAGLQRFIGEHLGSVGDSMSYAIGSGVATVTARRMVAPDSSNHLYFLRSEGTVQDPRQANSPARRVVGTYAWHRQAPLAHAGAVVLTGGEFRVEGGAQVRGLDDANPSMCSGAGGPGTAGVATSGRTRTRSGGSILGNPETDTYANSQAVLDALGVRWDILSSPNFPVEFDGSVPNFASMPADSFPLVRYQGNLTAHWWWSGRGVLIVTGRFRAGWSFSWDGIILAGEFGGSSGFNAPSINGMVVGGLERSNPNARWRSGQIRYHSCNVEMANRALSYLDVVENTVFEVN